MTGNRQVSGKCGICGQQLDALRFTQQEATDLGLNLETKHLVGIVCTKCGAFYCGLQKHKKELGYSLRRGWTCSSCGHVMGFGKSPNDLLFAQVPVVQLALAQLSTGGKDSTEGFISRAIGKLDFNALKRALRSGKWIANEEQRQKLLEQATIFEEQLMRDILRRADPQTMELAGRDFQKEAFLEWAALASIGADWALSEKYVHDGLYAAVRKAIEYKPGPLRFSVDDAEVAAALLLMELPRESNAVDYIPHILVAPQELRYRKECNFIKWFFARLWTFMDDERVVDSLIKALDETTSVVTEYYAPGLTSPMPEIDPSDGIIAMMSEDAPCYPPDKPTAVPGPAYHAAELLLMYGEERGISALVPAVLNPKQGPYYGSHVFKSAYDFFAEQRKPRKMFETLTTRRGQLALLSKYLIKALDAENFEICRLAARALGLIDDQEAVNTTAIPMMFDRLAEQPQGFLDSVGGNIMSDLPGSARVTEEELQSLESLWMPDPFIDALEHKDYRVRLVAIRALQKIGDYSAITALSPLLEDDHRKVQKAAKKAITDFRNDRSR